jgi:restriction system protein
VTIPKHDEIRVPALLLLAERGQLKLSEFEAPLAEHFNLTEDDQLQELQARTTRTGTL